MQASEVHAYARKLFEAHGEKAEFEAAQKIREFDEAGDHEQAEVWRRVRASIAALRGPHAS